MVLMTLFALLSSQPAVIGTDGDDLPVAARLQDDGTVAVVIQTIRDEGSIGYSLALFPPGGESATLSEIDTGLAEPTWTRGCFWVSYPWRDDVFALLVADGWDREDEPQILYFEMGTDGSANRSFSADFLRIPDGWRVSAATAAPNRFTYITLDECGADGEGLVGKYLEMIGMQGEGQWRFEVPCEGWWMNPDLIRTLPDGGCAVASDEDGFDETLYLSRFTGGRVGRLWSLEYETGGEMTHHMTELLPAPDGGLLAVGVTDLFTMRDHAFILLVDSTGTIVSETVEDGPGNLRLTCGLALPDGRFLLAGWAAEAGEYPMDRPGITDCLVTVDSRGAVEALTTLSGSDREPCFLLPDGNGVVLVGMMPSTDSYGSDVYVERLEDIP
jgi:hypothetical protein